MYKCTHIYVYMYFYMHMFRYKEDEIEAQVAALRTQLTSEGYKTTPLSTADAKDTHRIAEVSQQKKEQLRAAFKIRDDYVDGSAFDPVQQAMRTAEAKAEREKKLLQE